MTNSNIPASWVSEYLGRYAMQEFEVDDPETGHKLKVWALYDRIDEDPCDIGYISREDVAQAILRCLNGDN